jgi:hypothetical protein
MTEKPEIGGFCWNELATTNVKAAKEFYSKVFGWTFSEHDMGDTVYTMIKVNDKEVGGIWSIPKDKESEIPPHWMVYILVDDLEQAVEKTRKHGASLIKPATNAGDLGRFAIIADPTGAHFALWHSNCKCSENK